MTPSSSTNNLPKPGFPISSRRWCMNRSLRERALNREFEEVRSTGKIHTFRQKCRKCQILCQVRVPQTQMSGYALNVRIRPLAVSASLLCAAAQIRGLRSAISLGGWRRTRSNTSDSHSWESRIPCRGFSSLLLFMWVTAASDGVRCRRYTGTTSRSAPWRCEIRMLVEPPCGADC